MDKEPLWFILLYSVPESIILVTFSCALFGYPIKQKLARILLLGSILAGIAVFVRALPVQGGVNTIIEIPIFFIMTAVVLRISFMRAVLYMVSSFVVLVIGEMISYPLISYLSGHPIKFIVGNHSWRFIGGWTNLLFILILIAIILKKDIKFLRSSANTIDDSSKKDKNTILLTALLGGQVSIAVVFTIIMYLTVMSPFPVFHNAWFIAIAGGLLLVLSLISGIFIRRVYLASEQAAVIESYETFMDNVNKLFTVVRGQRHDFIHHVQVIYSMFKTNKTDDLDQYLNTLLDEIQVVNDSIRVKNPVLNALLNSKKAVAEGRGVNLEIAVRDDLTNTKLKPLDMVKILGNLIDNAIEAVKDEPVEFRKVNVLLAQVPKGQVLEVSNLRPVIDDDKLEGLFISGFTTKENHSGLGLAIIKELVDKYGGKIGVKSSLQEGTVFTVMIPAK